MNSLIFQRYSCCDWWSDTPTRLPFLIRMWGFKYIWSRYVAFVSNISASFLISFFTDSKSRFIRSFLWLLNQLKPNQTRTTLIGEYDYSNTPDWLKRNPEYIQLGLPCQCELRFQLVFLLTFPFDVLSGTKIPEAAIKVIDDIEASLNGPSGEKMSS